MKALLALVDFQIDYLRVQGLEPSAGHVVQQAARLAARCRASGIPVAHVWTTVSRGADDRMPHWKAADSWRCEEGTAGHSPPAALQPAAGDAIYHKTAFSAFGAPGFAQRLREQSIDTLIIAGVHTHACVRQTALDAYQAGLRVAIVEDAVASDDPVHAAITRRYLDGRCMPFVTLSELDAALPDLPPSGSRRTDDVVERAVASAASGATELQRLTFDERRNLVRRLAHSLHEEVASIAMLAACEIGKPLRFARVEVERTVEMLRAIADRGGFDLEVEPNDRGQAFLRRRPLGVCAVITPWNNPVYIPLGKIAPAVLCGNTVVWKPAPQASRVTRAIELCLREAGWPDEFVTLLEGDRRVATRLMQHERVDGVIITGSSSAGYAAQEICARRRIPLQAELGGNNAAIVWPDADMGDAARQIAAGAFDQAGQRCTSNRRVIVHDLCRTAFLDALLRETEALPWGDPRCERTRIGPIVDAGHRDDIAAIVHRAEACGPVLQPHGCASPVFPDLDAAWYPPTIVCCDDLEHEIVQEETFGPVLVVQPARDWDHAMRQCNGVRQGLAAAVFTRDGAIVDRFLNEARAGILKVNRSTADASVDVPFGGWKASGIGPPEHGRFDLEFFTRPQTVYADSQPAR